MKFENVFTLKDFFNYYFPGFVWLMCLAALVVPVGDAEVWERFLTEWKPIFAQINGAIWLVALAVVPYLVGFTMNPLGELLTEQLRKRSNDAISWVTDPSEKLYIHGLSSDKRSLIEDYAKSLFKVREIALRDYFYEIRAFVAHQGGGAYELSVRALDLVNFSEAMLIPVPLLIGILGLRFVWIALTPRAQGFHPAMLAAGIIVLLFSLLAFSFLKRRYRFLRGYWVKHIYRAFLAIMSRDKPLTHSRDESQG